MKTKMNLNGTTRKALVAAIAEITGEKAIYRAMPTCNYDIGEITVTKDGCIVFPDGSDILTALAAAGFFPEEAEADAEAEDPTGLTVSLPKDGFTEASLDNLRKLVDAKASLMRKALGADRLDITVTDGKVSFPWWDRMLEPEEAQAYMSFLAALCAMAKEAKRVLAKEAEDESEKYAFRCFLLRLGFIGDDSKAARNTEAIDVECSELADEMEVVEALTKKLIAENATTVMPQDEYNRKYDALVQRYHAAEERIAQLQGQKVRKRFQADVMECFITELMTLDASLPVQYSDRLWLNLIDRVTVYEDGSLVFRFKNGMEITEML